jgi:hypothetical protein
MASVCVAGLTTGQARSDHAPSRIPGLGTPDRRHETAGCGRTRQYSDHNRRGFRITQPGDRKPRPLRPSPTAAAHGTPRPSNAARRHQLPPEPRPAHAPAPSPLPSERRCRSSSRITRSEPLPLEMANGRPPTWRAPACRCHPAADYA